MTLSQMEYFVKVAETGHLTQAAAELMVAQPSITQSIRKLERELGFPLFERVGRRIILTREGAAFLTYAKDVAAAHEKAKLSAYHIRQENQGLIRFAHTEPTPKLYIPNLIYSFLARKENKGVRIESDIAGTAKIFESLRNDEIDFGFCGQGVEDDAEDLTMYPLFKHPIVLITSKDDPLSTMDSVSLEELARRPCVSYGTNSAMYQQIQTFWTEHGIQPDVRYRSSAVAIGGLVARGLGWAFVALTDEILDEDIAIVNMPELTLERTMYLAMRTNRMHGPAAMRFRDFVLSYTAKTLGLSEKP